MPDLRDYRTQLDLTVPPEIVEANPAKVAELNTILAWFFTRAVVINEGLANEERGYINLQRCGHRLKLSCDTFARWEVGRGKVI